MRANPMRQVLGDGGTVVGTMVFEFRTPAMPLICAAAGADFVVFDQEATGCTMETLATLMAVAHDSSTMPFVRVPATERHLLTRPLDVGAAGLMVPTVESGDQAKEIVDATKYPPRGTRGVIGGLAGAGYSAREDIRETLRSANEETMVLAQIESAAGVEHVEEIAAVDGIDVLWLGHLDLTVSMGIPGEYDHPSFTEAVERIISAAKANGKAAATKVGTVEQGRRSLDQGFRCIAFGDDVRLFRDGLRAGVEGLRAGSRQRL